MASIVKAFTKGLAMGLGREPSEKPPEGPEPFLTTDFTPDYFYPGLKGEIGFAFDVKRRRAAFFKLVKPRKGIWKTGLLFDFQTIDKAAEFADTFEAPDAASELAGLTTAVVAEAAFGKQGFVIASMLSRSKTRTKVKDHGIRFKFDNMQFPSVEVFFLKGANFDPNGWLAGKHLKEVEVWLTRAQHVVREGKRQSFDKAPVTIKPGEYWAPPEDSREQAKFLKEMARREKQIREGIIIVG